MEEMFYYEVLVASPRYHKREPLTYASPMKLPLYSLVVVELQKQRVPGMVVAAAQKPSFATKPLIRADQNLRLPKQMLRLYQWLNDYYPAPGGTTAALFLPSYLVSQNRSKVIAPPLNSGETAKLPSDQLTTDQANAIAAIQKGVDHSYLLHGDTGTGKTRVYLEVIAKVIQAGQSAIVLTPEIGLTPQLTKDFETAFTGSVVVIHSEMSIAERRHKWQQIATAESPVVVIGPRSALFAPVHKLGVIIIDEAHDTSYKQEQMPYYQTTRIAAQLAQLAGAKLVLGSATPLLADYYIFEQKKLPILRMKQIPGTKGSTKDVHLINLRDKAEFSRSSILSNLLLTKVQDALGQHKQSLLFLNRRGTARLVLCQNCGWQALCPRCDLPLTFHADKHHLRCHTCGYATNVPSTCAECHSTDIIFQSIGTKALVTELQKHFPQASIRRFDGDTTGDEQLHNIYDELKSGQVDIVVGTQMIAKGLDLPKLTVVGAVIADTSLYFPDFTADERTFQLLSQVCGRVGRGHGAGTVVVQSYNPDNPVVKAAVQNNYSEFFKQQITEREEFHFPPFYHLLKLSCTRKTSNGAAKAAESLFEKLQQYRGIDIIGPAPAFMERSNNNYKWQIIVRTKDRKALVKIITTLLPNWQYDIDPSNLL